MLALLLLLMNDDLFSRQADLWFRQLLAESGYGTLQREHAAFLIRESDGGLTLEPWPDRGFRHASFRGTVPQRVIAVLHTHPRYEPRPSAHDRAEARRLGMPVITITPEAVIAAMPDGTEAVIRGERTPSRASGMSRVPSARRTSPPR
jgi:hypothetical protein